MSTRTLSDRPSSSWDMDFADTSPARAFVGSQMRWQLVAGMGMLMVFMVLTPVTVGLFAGLPLTTEALWTGYDGVPPWAVLAGRVSMALLILVGYLTIVARIGRVPGVGFVAPRDGGVTTVGTGLLRLMAGFGLGTAVLVVVVGGMIGFGAATLNPGTWGPGVLVGVASGLAAGVWEETVFRGLFQRLLHGWLGWWQAYLAMIVFFGLLHYSGDVWATIAITLQAGPLLGAMWLATRRLWLGIGYHIAWNAMQSVLFSTEAEGGLWRLERAEGLVSGGASGIEGSLLTLAACMALSALFLFVAHRRGFLSPLDPKPRPAEKG